MFFIGHNGHYYCGLRVLTCTCCDGICGPQRGCNCLPCQQLDQEEATRSQTKKPCSSTELVDSWVWANKPCKFNITVVIPTNCV